MTGELLDVAGVAALTGLKRDTIHKHTHRETMPAPDYRLAGRPVWLRSTIERWMREREGTPDIAAPVDF